MTGFAAAGEQFPFGRLGWEVRSVNHRYLEYSLRLPEEFRVLEPKVRDILSGFVQRGKIDATLRFHPMGGAGGALALNRDVATRLLELHEDLATMAGTSQEVDVAQLLRWPGVVTESLADPAPMHEAALALLSKAGESLVAVRGREGEKMAAMVKERLDGVEQLTRDVRSWLPDIRTALRDRMRERVAELGQTLDPERLDQEVAVLAQKMDVDEELDRLDAHVAETRRTLTLSKPVGRRLDFLMQEFNRESNTLSSKSVDQRTTQAAVELKVLIEQMREQVQNVE
ncbi:MAG: YicC/YloC family endoribonuclease [Pseudomonadota bacterium]